MSFQLANILAERRRSAHCRSLGSVTPTLPQTCHVRTLSKKNAGRRTIRLHAISLARRTDLAVILVRNSAEKLAKPLLANFATLNCEQNRC